MPKYYTLSEISIFEDVQALNDTNYSSVGHGHESRVIILEIFQCLAVYSFAPARVRISGGLLIDQDRLSAAVLRASILIILIELLFEWRERWSKERLR